MSIDRRSFLATAAAMLSLSGSQAWGDDPPQKKGKGKSKGNGKGRGKGKGGDRDYALPAALAEFDRLSVVLGRPDAKSVAASLLAKEPIDAYFEYGTSAGNYDRKSKLLHLAADAPTELVLDELAPSSEYYSRLRWRKAGVATFESRPECRFRTRPTAGTGFTFTIQGDSHPERPQMSEPNLYARTLLRVAADQPDFHVCMGDDFSVQKLREFSPEALAQPYLLQRPFLGLVGQTAPLFLVNGNHEQASLYNFNQDDVRHDVAVGVQKARNKLFPLPTAGGIYSGDSVPQKGIGQLRDYYAWTWGDALFVVLDNYWHSPGLVDTGFHAGGDRAENEKKNRNWWTITLGDAQYHWFKRTLEASTARHKFVFAHHVLGTGRGGVDMADLYEWGGRGKRGDGDFKQKRPGWELPVHQLMTKHGVSIFFQGHDHLYCRQEKDGVVYQEVPMPSDHTYTAHNVEAYDSGVKLPNSGYLRVQVEPAEVKVEYVRSMLVNDEGANKSGQIAHSYVVKAGRRHA